MTRGFNPDTLPFANISTCSCITAALRDINKCQIKIDMHPRTYPNLYHRTLFTDISCALYETFRNFVSAVSRHGYRRKMGDKMHDSLWRRTISLAIHPLKSSVVRFFVGASRPLNFLSEITYRWEGILISQHDGRRYQPFANGCLLAYDNTA